MSSGPCILESFLGSAIWGRRQREQANLSVKSPAMGRWSFPDILHHRAAATNDCLWHIPDIDPIAEWGGRKCFKAVRQSDRKQH
jgi:hypothetical protein